MDIFKTILPYFLLLVIFEGCTEHEKINREKVVLRHVVEINSIDTLSSLTAGNGQFAFTVDFTGLQSFPGVYENGIPLGTQSDWGWHSFPDHENLTFEESLKNYDFHGREIPLAVRWKTPERKRDAGEYFYMNPHRLHLGIIGLDFLNPDGSMVRPEEISEIEQTLNPWNGQIHSTFMINGESVSVTTFCHQEMDMVTSKIESSLIRSGVIRVKFHFPYPSDIHTHSGCDWGNPDKHVSELINKTSEHALIRRSIDTTAYNVSVSWKGKAKMNENEKHLFYLEPEKDQSVFSFSCHFTQAVVQEVLPDFDETSRNSHEKWKDFWMSGGAVDFSGSTDKRAFELERRIILSQYLTKVQCTGLYPPQETGLTYNSWHGKFHLEMYWWHAVHFALWNRIHLIEKSLDWHATVAAEVRKNAARQGFEGARWQKMTDPWGGSSPSEANSGIIWQQPHFIYMAELCYRNSPRDEILRKYAGLVFETADFMASFAWFDSLNNRYVLGPGILPGQERFPVASTINPSFELVYWYQGLTIAQEWRNRSGLERDPDWDRVIRLLSAVPVKDGLYLAAESAPDSYTNPRYLTDHPMVLGAYGMIPGGVMIDSMIMKNTFNHIWTNWHWKETWGWDFPLTAMAATRLGIPEKAIDALFMDITTNTYLPNGHNFQNNRLRLYLPGNGGILSAVAMMCAGYEGSSEKMPGFPKNDKWKVKWENLQKLP